MKIKKLIEKIVPYKLIFDLRSFKQSINENKEKKKYNYNQIKKIFDKAEANNSFLSKGELKRMQKLFPFPKEYGYSQDILNERGETRANHLLKIIPTDFESILEIGCGDGMVSNYLFNLGKNATGIDLDEQRFNKSFISKGVNLIKTNAEKMSFKDNSFDVVFSFNAFEHFSKPDKVLSEMHRVVKPGGFVYLNFGPLYNAPMGMHAYREISVPYCQFLFSKKVLHEFVKENDPEFEDFTYCNEWSLIQYRNLWNQYSEKLKIKLYNERFVFLNLELVQKYAPYFKNRTDSFEDLTCTAITVLFKKK